MKLNVLYKKIFSHDVKNTHLTNLYTTTDNIITNFDYITTADSYDNTNTDNNEKVILIIIQLLLIIQLLIVLLKLVITLTLMLLNLRQHKLQID